MIKKQFKAIGKDIWQNNEIWCIAGSEHCADVISTALNEQGKKNKELMDSNHELKTKCALLEEENEYYKVMFFEIVEKALTDKNCRKEYCKGILSIFDECNDLNEAKKQIMEFLE